MITIRDVARKARVSTYTVSVVLNRSARVSPELTERVEKAARELKYTPNAVARSLQTRRTKTVAMLIPDIASPFYANVVRGVEDRLRRDGYSLLLGNTYNDPAEQERYLVLFRSRQADGILLFVAAGGEDDAKRLVDEGKPVVFVGRSPLTFQADSVTADNKSGTALAIEHLISRGHRHIGIITGQKQLSTSTDRVAGWRAALRRHKLSAPAGYVGEADWTEDGGFHAANRVLDRHPEVTAFFAANFRMMTGLLRALQERGLRCPQDVEAASSDDSSWLDVFSPPISTVVQPSYQMGEQSAALLLLRMEKPDRPVQSIVLKPELRVRTAPAAPRG